MFDYEEYADNRPIARARRENEKVRQWRKVRDASVRMLLSQGFAKIIGPNGYILVSEDKEWLSEINSIGELYTKGVPFRGNPFIIDGEI